MFIYKPFVFFALVTFNIFSQAFETYEHEFIGLIMLESKALYPYKINFNIDNDSIKGYSYTDIDGPNETRSAVKGVYNKKTKHLSFVEKDILYTKSKVDLEEFCFIKLDGELKLKTNKKTLKGDFIGYYPDKTECGKGKIRLVGKDYATKKISKIKKQLKKKRVDSVTVKKIEQNKFLETNFETKIKSGEEVSVFIRSSELRIEIWDYGKEDRDIISIELNGNPVLTNYIVKKTKKVLILNLPKSKNLLKFITVNSGELETNTTKIKIYDIRRSYEILANLNVGKPASINIYKVTK